MNRIHYGGCDMDEWRQRNLRQFRHNNGDGLLFGYHKESVDILIDTNEQQAQTIKELQAQVERFSRVADALSEAIIEYTHADTSDEYSLAHEKIQKAHIELGIVRANTPAQSLSAIRNEAIREGWDMCKNAGIKQLECWTHSTGKMALRSFRNLPYPQLTEEE